MFTARLKPQTKLQGDQGKEAGALGVAGCFLGSLRQRLRLVSEVASAAFLHGAFVSQGYRGRL